MKNSTGRKILRLTVFSALLAAVSIVCGKFLAFNVGEFIRFSFENLPIIFAGMAFGPIVGVCVGAVADLVGCLLVGYAINPIITLGASVIGLLSGLSRPLLKTGKTVLFTVVTVAVAHLIGSVVIKSFGLSVFYSMPLYMLMAWRLLNYAIVGAIEGFVLYHLLKNRAILHLIEQISNKQDKKEK